MYKYSNYTYKRDHFFYYENESPVLSYRYDNRNKSIHVYMYIYVHNLNNIIIFSSKYITIMYVLCMTALNRSSMISFFKTRQIDELPIQLQTLQSAYLCTLLYTNEEFFRLSEQLRTRLSPLAHIFARSSSPASTLFFRFKEYLLVSFRFLYESQIPVFFISLLYCFYYFFFHAIMHVHRTECFRTFTIYHHLILSFVSLTKFSNYLAEFRLFDSYRNSFDHFFNLFLYTRNIDISTATSRNVKFVSLAGQKSFNSIYKKQVDFLNWIK